MKKIIALVFFYCFFCFSAHAEENFSAERIEKFELQNLSNISKLIIIDTSVEKPRAYILKHFNNTWVCLKDVPCEIGSSGAKEHKIEGDRATPKGIFNFIIAIGMRENPGSLLPYYTIKPGDVWVTDPQSKYYNLFVRKDTVFVDWSAQIELSKRPIRYAYALVIDYNISHREPYIGSAFFVQCSNGKPTEGSIGLPRSVIEELLTFVDKETKIYIY